METRKVQLTGGSTFTVSLPKEWAERNGVSAGTELGFLDDDDSLTVTTRLEAERSSGELDVTDLTGDDLTRAVMTMYVSGFDVITISADRITAEQRQAIRGATQNLIGVEVLEETTDRVVIQDLLDAPELSVTNTVERMHLIATSMLVDAVEALTESDDELARDVIERDDDVDRLWLVVSRIFRGTLRSPAAATALGITREDCFDYHSSARQLERIADHAVKIAQIALKLDPVEGSVREALEALHDDAVDIVDGSVAALLADDADRAVDLANESRSAVIDIDEHTRQIDQLLREFDPRHAQSLGLIVDSLSRSADYGGNIAETALQKAAPRP
ncbi:MAG: PhoU domain-containing protein [Halobacteriales archaeon]